MHLKIPILSLFLKVDLGRITGAAVRQIVRTGPATTSGHVSGIRPDGRICLAVEGPSGVSPKEGKSSTEKYLLLAELSLPSTPGLLL